MAEKKGDCSKKSEDDSTCADKECGGNIGGKCAIEESAKFNEKEKQKK